MALRGKIAAHGSVPADCPRQGAGDAGDCWHRSLEAASTRPSDGEWERKVG